MKLKRKKMQNLPEEGEKEDDLQNKKVINCCNLKINLLFTRESERTIKFDHNLKTKLNLTKFYSFY